MSHRARLLVAIVLAVLAAAPSFALDTPTVAIVNQGFGKAVVTVTAGDSGAPNGFTVWWMSASDYAANGNQMTYYPSSIQGTASFTGVPTLNTWDGTLTSFVLAPNQTVMVEIGDLEDETGVWSNMPQELTAGTAYLFCASANAAEGIFIPESGFSTNESASTSGDQDCTFTQGYWKTHGPGSCQHGNNSNEWPVAGLTLGVVPYSDMELCEILEQPTQGNGLVSLAHQLIAAKLNIANGTDPSDIDATVTAADALIGALVVPPSGAGFIAPAVTSSLTQALDDYNNGITGPGHCAPPVSIEESTWGQVKGAYR